MLPKFQELARILLYICNFWHPARFIVTISDTIGSDFGG